MNAMRNSTPSLYDGRPRKVSTRGLAASLLIFIAFVWMIWSHPFRDSQLAKGFKQVTRPPYLDAKYQIRTAFDIVMSMYREDPVEVAVTVTRILNTSSVPSDYRIWIYIKADDVDIHALATHFPPGRTHIIKRPNIGRDSETHLHHILSKWDDLARHTLLMQAGMDEYPGMPELLQRIESHFVPETGMLNLGFVSICDCHACADPYWHDTSGLLPQTYALANRDAQCEWLVLSYQEQFIASAARIRGAGQGVYRYLHSAMVEPGSWAHQESYLSRTWTSSSDSMNKPALGFSVERLWMAIMQCSNLEVAMRCPSLLSGTRIDVTAGDCQCLD